MAIATQIVDAILAKYEVGNKPQFGLRQADRDELIELVKEELLAWHDSTFDLGINAEKKRVGEGWIVLRNEEDQESNQFFITPIDYWKENNCISDSISDGELPCPPGFTSCMEGCLSYEGKDENPFDLLIEAGFREVQWGEKI